jgi:hypothetical protein
VFQLALGLLVVVLGVVLVRRTSPGPRRGVRAGLSRANNVVSGVVVVVIGAVLVLFGLLDLAS